MEWSSVVSAISTAAPILGSLIGPAGTAVGALAGTGIKLAARALGVEPTQDAVADAIATDPNALLKLKQFEMEHRIELEKLGIQKLQYELADIQGARIMRTEHERITGRSDYNLYILAWIIVLGFFGLMALLFKFELPPDQNGVIFVLFGALASGFGQVLSFFFGSNKSSENKTDMIFNSTPNVPKKGGVERDK